MKERRGKQPANGVKERYEPVDSRNEERDSVGSLRTLCLCFQALKKALEAYKSCEDSGLIDDLTEEFPITCSGTQWAGVTDRVMGGRSSGTLAREEYHGRMANVLRAKVSLENNGGFVQMATDLALNPAVSSTVDASKFDGIEADLFYEGEEEIEKFNVQ